MLLPLSAFEATAPLPTAAVQLTRSRIAARRLLDLDIGRQQRGPVGFLATSRWQRNAFSNLRFEHHEILIEGSTVIAVAIMMGEHTGIFTGIEATGKPINHKHVHIFDAVDGQITHHGAVRDDLGLLLQLGWRPSNPV